jgi:hypothetical protein
MDEIDFHAVFTLDAETGRLFWKLPPKNHAEKAGMEAGSLNVGKGKNGNYWQVRAFGKTFKRSRVVFHMTHGRWPDPAVDHINRDSTDDRPANLRECTYSQNNANTRDKARSLALPRGVYITRQGRYMARLTNAGATQNLGTFDTPQLARSAYEAARKETFREFA